MDKLQKLINEIWGLNYPKQFDSAIIVSPHNRRYFTNFNSSSGYLFVTKDASYLLVDFRYIEAANNTVSNCEVVLYDNIEKKLSELIKKT